MIHLPVIAIVWSEPRATPSIWKSTKLSTLAGFDTMFEDSNWKFKKECPLDHYKLKHLKNEVINLNMKMVEMDFPCWESKRDGYSVKLEMSKKIKLFW